MKVKKEYSKEERRNQILTYLRNHETVHRTKLMEQFSITKATLSTDLKALKALGNPIETVSCGVIRLAIPNKKPFESISESPSDCIREILATISGKTIRQWLILYLLNQSTVPLSRNRLERKYSTIVLGDENSPAFLHCAFQKALHALA